jgi:TRAP-type mannitol/chloroaromatic compound transport system permease small subunit
MGALAAISNFIDRFLAIIARIAAWAGVVLIGITIFDVITRRFFVLGSTKLQEAEWHAHVILFTLLIGYTYIKDAHVRIDLVRERLSERTQWWIELLGCLLFLIPYCVLVVYFSYDFTVRSYINQEISSSATGLTHRWIIKSFLPIGFTLLGLAGIAVVFRKIVELFGPPDLREQVHEIEEEEAEALDKIALDREGPR